MNNLKELWTQIKTLFAPFVTERAIKEVESWDGSASRFDSTEAYCNACLINVNSDSDPETWTQDHCMLPIREPGDGSDTYVKQAVYAAAGGRGISAVEKPEDVSPEAWDSAVKSAASALISAYGQMDETAPASVYEAAGETSPEDSERAVSSMAVLMQLDWSLFESDANLYLHDLYVDSDGALYAIASSEGKLYRSEITVMDGAVQATEWIPVEVQHVPVSRGMAITRQENGRYRWAGVACTAILNKDHEIDSTVLFGAFVDRFTQQDRASDPVQLDFYHEDIFLGDVDYLAQDGYALIASGLFIEGEVGETAARSIQANPEEWGQSISYTPLAPPSFIDVGNGIEFPVWEDGKLERIALLPKDRASAWYTTFTTRSKTMKPQILDALKRLVGEEQAEMLSGQVDGVNDRVTQEGLIARSADPDPAETPDPEIPDPDPAETVDRETAPETPETPETSEVVAPDVQVIREMRTAQGEIQEGLKALTALLQDFVPDVQERLSALEATEQERRQAWLSDLPDPQTRTVLRPRDRNADGDGEEEEIDSSTRVSQTLASKGLAPAA